MNDEVCIELNGSNASKVAEYLAEHYGSRIEKVSDTNVIVWDKLESEIMRDITTSEESLDKVCEEISSVLGFNVPAEMFEF